MSNITEPTQNRKQLIRRDICPHCEGKGAVIVSFASADGKEARLHEIPCPTCHGTRMFWKPALINVLNSIIELDAINLSADDTKAHLSRLAARCAALLEEVQS